MKVLNLRCAHHHVFEGWFASEDDFQSQLSREMVECPICGDKDIMRLPSAPRLNVSGATPPEERPTQSGAPAAADERAQALSAEVMRVQSMWLKAVQHVVKHTDDVGDRFAEEARRMHYGEIKERGIRGHVTAQEGQALQEEGIEVLALPLPVAGSKGPIQ